MEAVKYVNIQNSSLLRCTSAIYLKDCNICEIYNNDVSFGNTGIYGENTLLNLSNNCIHHFEMYGIHLITCSQSNLEVNRIYECEIGLYVHNSDNCYFHENLIYYNQEFAIDFRYSENIYLEANFVLKNGDIEEGSQIFWYESTFELGSWNIYLAHTDFDADGESNIAEIVSHGTNPLKRDTIGDLFLDGTEVFFGTDPLDENDFPENTELIAIETLYNYLDGNMTAVLQVIDQLGITVGDIDELYYNTSITCSDTDCDNLNDAYEIKIGTDPLNDDSDGDSWFDGVEVASGTDPLNSNDYPGQDTHSDDDQSGNQLFLFFGIAGGIGIGILISFLLNKRKLAK